MDGRFSRESKVYSMRLVVENLDKRTRSASGVEYMYRDGDFRNGAKDRSHGESGLPR